MKINNTLFLFLIFALNIKAQNVNTGSLFVGSGAVFSSIGSFTNTSTGDVINNGQFYFFSNYTNDGSFNFTPGFQGSTYFEGNNIQILSGNNPSYFFNLTFNNSHTANNAFQLSNIFSVTNSSSFTRGILDNRNFGGQIIFEDDATVTIVSDNSHVDGIVDKIGNDEFEFPVGNNGFFRFSSISSPNSENDYYISSYTFDDPTTFGYPTSNFSGVIELVDNAEFWLVDKVSGSDNVVLTLSYSNFTTPSEILSTPLDGSLRIVRWDENQQIWVDEGGIVDESNQTVTTFSTLTDYGIFTLGRAKSNLLLPGDVVIYNSVTPNGDGMNDYFFIDKINLLQNNNVEIYNRWGIKVFNTDNYDSNGNVFKGEADNGFGSNLLPTGTYFYIINYDYSSGGITERVKKAGYLYLITE